MGKSISSKLELNNEVRFYNKTEELIKLSKWKFYWKWKEVKDVNKIYERFSERMNTAEEVRS